MWKFIEGMRHSSTGVYIEIGLGGTCLSMVKPCPIKALMITWKYKKKDTGQIWMVA